MPSMRLRAKEFADAVRGRARAGVRPSTVALVHRLGIRRLVVHAHEHRHAGAVSHVRLNLALGVRVVDGARPRTESRVAPARLAPTPVRQEQLARRSLDVAPPARVAGRPPASPAPRSPERRMRTAAPPSRVRAVPVAPVARAEAAPALRAQPAVPLIHRVGSPDPTAPAAAARASAGSASDMRAFPPAVPSAPVLTTADLPIVVDRVVGEIDRRIAASRERRGWVA